MDTATLRVRPLRFAFLVEPRDKSSLMRVFEANSALWGGVLNFIIPLFKRVPTRYRWHPQDKTSATTMLNGLVEAFQPDFLVETVGDQVCEYRLDFPKGRVKGIDELGKRDEKGRCAIGVDLRSVCEDLYNDTYRFVERHPHEVLMPEPSSNDFRLFFAATFGFLAEGTEIAKIYETTLGGQRRKLKPLDFPSLFHPKFIYPLRVTHHNLETHKRSFSLDSKLFYMDEKSSFDLIEYWNLRALGWDIVPLPARLSDSLIEYCNEFVRRSYRPFPPPSNAFHHASLLCARSQSLERMKELMAKLVTPGPMAITLDTRVPRIWEEWGRSADHAEAQLVSNLETEADASIIGHGLHLRTELHDFGKDDHYCAQTVACANVLESISGGTPVIPWEKSVAARLTQNFGEEKTWIGREGIVAFAGKFNNFTFLRVPNAINIFSSLAESIGYSLTISAAGRTCEQIIAAVGDLKLMGIVARGPEILRLLDRMAHEDVEVEVETVENGETKKKKVSKPYVHFDAVVEALSKSFSRVENRRRPGLAGLIRSKVLDLGMALKCVRCGHTSWFSLERLAPTLECPRCFGSFDFPSAQPPRDAWAYRVTGPFAASNLAHGAYCVANALAFLTTRIAETATWLPSFVMKNGAEEFEPDFGLLALPNRFANRTSPYFVLGECKSFNRFDQKDFARARKAAHLFPGAILCFCTFNDSLSKFEIRELTKLVMDARNKEWRRKAYNPILILTGRELFRQFDLADISTSYGPKAQHARSVYMRRNFEEFSNFTQEAYLGVQPVHQWQDDKRKKRGARIAARQAITEEQKT